MIDKIYYALCFLGSWVTCTDEVKQYTDSVNDVMLKTDEGHVRSRIMYL